jgi:hypothetical protein
MMLIAALKALRHPKAQPQALKREHIPAISRHD